MTYRIAAALALTAASSLQAQTATPVTTPAPVAPPTVDLSFATPAAGTWSYASAADGSEAVFRNSPLAQLTIKCTRSARVVTISKPASAAAPFLFVWTSTEAKSFPASFDPATGLISVRLSAFDPMLDAVAFSRGRLGVSVTGSPALVVPAWPETARVIEDCRV
jgi:hypothetical protein